MKEMLLHIEDNSFSERIAFRYYRSEDLITVTYRQFYADIRRAMGGLEKRVGTLLGTHIGLFAEINYEALVCMYAVWLSGGVIIPFNTTKEWEQISIEFVRSEAVYFLADEAYIKEHPQLAIQAKNKLEILDFIYDEAPQGSLHDFKQNQLSAILFTSGTTGESKGASISWHTLCTNAVSFTTYYDQRNCENIFYCLPIYHQYGIIVFSSCLCSGRTMFLLNSNRTFLENIQLSGCNCFAFVPGHVNYVQKALHKKQNVELGMMRDICCAGAPCSTELFDIFIKNGIRLSNYYGLTEHGIGAINLSENVHVMTHSVGRTFGDTKIKIENGEILLHGSSTMMNYYHDSEATAEAIQDGWLHTGDMGYLDEDGYLYITGRKKNLIILSSGENINPERIEALLSKNDRIIEVVVKEKDKQVCAEIYCEEADQPAIRAWVDEVNQGLAYYQHVTLVEFRSEPFEKTASGKIKRSATQFR